jgi:hypothetical protein
VLFRSELAPSLRLFPTMENLPMHLLTFCIRGIMHADYCTGRQLRFR